MSPDHPRPRSTLQRLGRRHAPESTIGAVRGSIGPRSERALAPARDSVPANCVRWAVNFRGQRRAIVRRYVFDTLAHVIPIIAVDTDGLRIYLSTSDKAVSRSIFARGLYERELFATAIDVLARYGSSAGIAGRGFLDIGANIGTATCLALTRYGASRAWAFEPAPDNVTLLRQNVFANDLRDRVQVHPYALSDRDGAVQFELADDNWGDHRVRVVDGGLPGVLDEQRRAMVEVPSRRLDTLVDAGAVNLDEIGLAWIDVQGHEAHVLAGASELLRAQIPIVSEYWPYGLRRANALDLFHELLLDAARWSSTSAPRTAERPLQQSFRRSGLRRVVSPSPTCCCSPRANHANPGVSAANV